MRMVPRSFPFLLLVFSVGPLASASLELQVLGNQVKDSNQCVIRLKGVNIASMEWTATGDGPPGSGVYPITVTVNETLTNWGADLIRLPLSQDRWFGYAGANATVYRSIVDSIVQMCSDHDAYVLLDLHWGDAGVWGSNIGQRKMPDNNSVTFWTDVATRYANHPAVLFDLYNEPYNISWAVWRDGGTVTEGSPPTLTYASPGMQGLLNAVRATGARNVIVAGGTDWGFDLTGIASGYALSDTSGNGIVYSSHIYPWKPTAWDSYVSLIKAAHPILVGEVGQEPPGQRQFVGGITPILDWIDANQYHWAGWDMHISAGPCMIVNWQFTPTSWEGVEMKTRLLATGSGQGCNTPTPTPTMTPTFTLTPTPTGTWYTETPTPIRTGTPDNGVEGIVLYPNPVREGGSVRFWVNFKEPAAEITVRFYTPASRLVAVKRFTNAGSGEYSMELRDDHGAFLSNGIYYLKFTTHTRERLCKLLILR